MNNKGQLTIGIALISAIGIIGASWLTSWATTNNRIQLIQTKVEVVEERENNHYLELQKILRRIEDKIDKNYGLTKTD